MPEKRSTRSLVKEEKRTLVNEEKPQPEALLFREMEHAMLDLERRMDRVVRDAFGDRALPFPLLQGLTLNKDAEGRLRVHPFGHLQESLDEFLEGWREPVLTWNVGEGGKTVVFHAEVPGIRKDDIEVEVTPDGLHIEGQSGATRYRSDCRPGYNLDPSAAEARYKDGVLTVSCRLAEPAGAKSRKVVVR